MSVINKMLRDLDQRRATALDPALRAGVVTATDRSGPSGMPSRSLWRSARGAGALFLLAVLLGAAWYWHGQTPESHPPAPQGGTMNPAPVAVPAASASLPAASADLAAVAPASQSASVPSSVAPASAALALVTSPPLEPVVAEPSAVAVPPAPKVSVKPLSPATVESPGLRLSSSLSMKPHAGPAVPVLSAAAPVGASLAANGPDPAVAAQRQQTATRDVLAQAQSLYSSGSADAAIQLLQDSLQAAERASPPAPAATQLALVRELARMELALGRASAVLELLGRVEPLLSGQADVWAVRANAAQRLGRHPEAVQFYATALQTRPSEPRWLLGSAVSQAALGQLASAAELAEKARAIGPVSKDVWTYLRQQGVNLSDRP
jgi:MSHA biogenesis protein MshN